MTNNSLDITKALQEGFDEFHKECGYQIISDAEETNDINTSDKTTQKNLLEIIKPRLLLNFLR